MAAITDLSDLINRATGGNSGTPENIWWHKVSRVSGVAPASITSGRMISFWQYDGSPSAGAVPTSGAIPDNTTTGGLRQANPGGGRQKWLIQAGAVVNTYGTLIIYDRLFHIGGLSGTSTADQTVQGATPSPALTRYTDGVGTFAFYEVFTGIGSTQTTLTTTYTNTANATQTSTIPIGSSLYGTTAQRAQFIPLASGDVGIKAIEKVKLTASTGTAGNFGIVIGKPLVYLVISATSVGSWRDYSTGLPSIPEVPSNSCLSMLWIPGSSNAPDSFGCMSFVEK